MTEVAVVGVVAAVATTPGGAKVDCSWFLRPYLFFIVAILSYFLHTTCAFSACAFSGLTSVGWAAGRHPACKKLEWWGAGLVMCLERGADLHMAQLMPLPLTVSCFNKIKIGFYLSGTGLPG